MAKQTKNCMFVLSRALFFFCILSLLNCFGCVSAVELDEVIPVSSTASDKTDIKSAINDNNSFLDKNLGSDLVLGEKVESVENEEVRKKVNFVTRNENNEEKEAEKQEEADSKSNSEKSESYFSRFRKFFHRQWKRFVEIWNRFVSFLFKRRNGDKPNSDNLPAEEATADCKNCNEVKNNVKSEKPIIALPYQENESTDAAEPSTSSKKDD